MVNIKIKMLIIISALVLSACNKNAENIASVEIIDKVETIENIKITEQVMDQEELSFLDKKFLDLYEQYELEQEYRSIELDDNKQKKLDAHWQKGIQDITEIFFDKNNNLWCSFNGYADGVLATIKYDINENEYKYIHTWTTSGGEDNEEWFDLYINDVRIENEKENIKKIFNEYKVEDIDFGHTLKLMLRNKKMVSEYKEDKNVDDFDSIYFGKSIQGMIPVAQPFEWIILYKDEEKALLLSKEIVSLKRIEGNELKNYLEKTFYYRTILTAQAENISYWGHYDGLVEEVGGVINNEAIILSKDDIKNYFKNVNNHMKAKGNIDTQLDYKNIYNDENKIAYKDMYFDYWINPTNEENGMSSYVDSEGNIKEAPISDIKGVRPAIWINLK